MTEYKTKHKQKDTNKTQISYNQLKITRMKKVKVFAMMAIAALSISSAKAQFAVGADVVSSYVWRGVAQEGSKGGSPNIQPFASYTIGGLTVGSWASSSFSGSVKEVDLYATYAFSPLFSATITDYNWGFGADEKGEQKYFNYKKDKTDHIFEGTLAYAGVESFPLSLSVNTMFYGADKKSNGDQAYSTYVELGYPLTTNAKVFLGSSLGESANYMTSKLGITNVGFKVSKTIAITDKFSLPVYGIVSANPYAKNAFFVAGITL